MRGCWSESKVYGGAAARGRVFHPIQQASPSRSSSHTSRSRWRKEAWQEAEQKTSRETVCKEGKPAQHHSSPATTTGPRDRHSPRPAAATAAAGDSQQQHHSAYSRSCCRQCTTATVKTTCYLLCCPRSSRTLAMTVTTAQQQHQNGLQQQQSSTRETRASKKRKVLLSPSNDPPNSNNTPPATPATPGFIPQVDGADSEPTRPDKSLATPLRDPPTPPPMSQHFPTDPYRVLCHMCMKNCHFLHYNQCEFCHYSMKFARKNCDFAYLCKRKSIKIGKLKMGQQIEVSLSTFAQLILIQIFTSFHRKIL